MFIRKPAIGFYLLFAWLSSMGYANTLPTKEILVIHSYHQGLEWTDNTTQGILEVLGNRMDVNLTIEYLDAKVNHTEKYSEALLNLIKTKKYPSQISAIITCDNAAFNFILENRSLYGDSIPVLYCGVNFLDTALVNNTPNLYGIEEKADHQGTLEAIRKIFPERKNVLIINDKTHTGAAIQKEFELATQMFKEHLNFEFLNDFSEEQLQNKVKKLDDSYVIYLLVLNRDNSGRFISYKHGINTIQKLSNAPIFGSWDFYLNKGIIGGSITKGLEQGKHVAGMALKILDADTHPNFRKHDWLESSYIFDYTIMKKFGVRNRDLPKPSITINNLNQSDLALRTTIVSVIALSFLVLVLLLILRGKRKQAAILEEIVRQRTKELLDTNAKLEDTIANKDKFFSILAHDLRNQIGTILTTATLLTSKQFALKQEKIDRLNENLLHLSHQTNGVLEDLLYWSIKQFKGDPAIHKTNFNVQYLLQCITDVFKINLSRVTFNYNIDPSIELSSDLQICKFIFRNIIQNAVKYSKPGGVVSIRSYRLENKIFIEIIDNGVGMTEEVVASIYQKTPIRKEGETIKNTTGLGLYNAIDYLELLNGDLEIRSKPGKGATFVVKFPVE